MKSATNTQYENILFRSPRGEPMFRKNRKAANWYVNRGLARFSGDSEVTFIIEPRGPGARHPLYLEERKNECVVCGTKEELVRYHIVPMRYRRLFPKQFVSRNSYDLVPLCLDCLALREISERRLTDALIIEYDAPEKKYEGEYKEFDRALRNVNTLLFNKSLPSQAKKKLEQNVKKVFGKVPNAEDYKVLKEEHKVRNATAGLSNHAQIVAGHLDSDDKIIRFIERWRQDFLDHMCPEYMPSSWAVKGYYGN